MSGWFFKRISVNRMPGCGGFHIDGLCDGINIIQGPNASGKTTTATAIRSLLWPDKGERDREVAATFGLDGRECNIDLCNGAASCTIEGMAQAAIPHQVARERSAAYCLPLSELMTGRDKSFAEQIQLQAAGGFDIAKASDPLGYAEKPREPSKLADELRESLQNINDMERIQTELSVEESDLREKRHQLASAEDSELHLGLLRKALAHAVCLEEYRAAESAVGQFDARMGCIRPEDKESAARLNQAISASSRHKSEAINERRGACARLRGSGLPWAGVALSTIDDLRGKQRVLDDFEKNLASKDTESAQCQGSRHQAFKSMIGSADPAKLAILTRMPPAQSRVVAQELLDYGKAAASYEADNQAQQALRQWVGDVSGTLQPDVVQRGIWILYEWLRASMASGPGKTGPSAWTLLACGAVFGIGIGLVAVSMLFLLLSVAAVVFYWLAARNPQVVRSSDDGHVFRQQYEDLNIDAPVEWSVESVRKHIGHLQALVPQLEKARHWHDLGARRAELENRRIELEQTKGQLVNRIGFSPDARAADILVLAESVGRWLDANETLAGLQSERRQLKTEADRIRLEMSSVLLRYGLQAVDSAGQAAAWIDELARRKQEHDSAVKARNDSRSKWATARENLRSAREEYGEFFRRRGIDPGDEYTLDRLVSDLDAYSAATKEVAERKGALTSAENGLRDEIALRADCCARWYPSGADEAQELSAIMRMLVEMPAGKIRDQIPALELDASSIRTLIEEIRETETRIDASRKSRQLEAELAARDSRREALRDARYGGYSSAAGWALADFVKQETRKESLPDVFNNASRILAQITNGAYSLAFDFKDMEFAALDTAAGRQLSLDQLSGATRVQSLLAVRLAFVEQQEQGVKLPILLDETLATSDDLRTERIIESLITISRDGRQVFYFTAQPHEVQKWQHFARHNQLVEGQDFTCVDLAQVRQLAEAKADLPAVEFRAVEVPVPTDGMSHEDYGRQLGVPAFDIAADDLGNTHIWYLIEDDRTLHRLLSEERLERWGPMQTAWETRPSKPLDDAQWQQAVAVARVLTSTARLWKVGRGKKLDVQALDDSGAISPTFRARVTELVDKHDGDARSIFRAVAELPRFRTTSRDELETYLYEHGYLDDDPQLTDDEIVGRVLDEVRSDVESNVITRELALRAVLRALPPDTAQSVSL